MKTITMRSQPGFTLIELLIGLVLGMIASLAIFATLSSFEAQRRTTGTGVDMQQNGLLALYSLEQDIRMAGFGLIDTSSTPGTLPCAKVNAYNPNSVFSAAPLVISDDATVGSNIITINRLNSDTGGIVTGGLTAKLQTALSAVGVMNLDTSQAIRANDFLLVSQPGKDCTLVKASSSSNSIGTSAAPATVTIAAAGNGGADTTLTPAAFPSYDPVSAVVINLGPASAVAATTFGSTDPTATPTFASTKYRISINAANNSYDLQRTTDNWNTNSVVAGNIVNVSAQYGINDPNDATCKVAGNPLVCQKVKYWVDATGNDTGGTNRVTVTTADGIKRIKAIRVAIVSRSGQKTDCKTTTVAPIWFDNPVAIDLATIVGADWTCYRYKVYQTVIPIRNVIWGNFQ
ncbi:MAG: prepilin-type N-terminal cleavage/methylation domain-containing protein [Gallionella sp.]|nr:prepilin-type N-terminal cleavage/methylation domain-containing protein [Gallionella sp.]